VADKIHFNKNSIDKYLGQYLNRVEELEESLISLEKTKVNHAGQLHGDANKKLYDVIERASKEQKENIVKERIIYETLKNFLSELSSSESSAQSKFN
jgi:polyhydroxyalkanoate synthesis regulator phasin